MGRRDAVQERCCGCHRTPLVGETVYVLRHGSVLCELCRALEPDPPMRLAARPRARVRAHDEADGSPGGLGPSAEPRGGLELRIPPVEPFTVSSTISKPREEVFEYLADIANHPEFTDHYLVDWRLTREESYGTGAGARFRMKAPFSRFSLGGHRRSPRSSRRSGSSSAAAAASTTASGCSAPTRCARPGRQHQARVHARDRAPAAFGPADGVARRQAAGPAARPPRRSAGCGRSSRRTAGGASAPRSPVADPSCGAAITLSPP